MGAAPARLLEVCDALDEEFLGAARPVGVEEGHGDEDGDLEASVLVGGPAQSAGQGPLGVLDHRVDGLTAQGGVPGAQADEVALCEVAAGEPVGEFGEASGAGRGVGFVGAEGVPHELFGLHAQAYARVVGDADLAGEGLGGLGQPVGVGEDLGEAVDDAVAQGRVGDGLLEGGAQVVDGGGGLGEQEALPSS